MKWGNILYGTISAYIAETTHEGPTKWEVDLKPALRELREVGRLHTPPKNAVEQTLDRLVEKLRRFIYNMPPPDERFRTEW